MEVVSSVVTSMMTPMVTSVVTSMVSLKQESHGDEKWIKIVMNR